MDWLTVTNFAIDRAFLDRAQRANDIKELRSCLTGDQFFGLASWYHDALPCSKRNLHENCQVALYHDAGWEAVRRAVMDADIALAVVRDIAWLTRTKYECPKFAAPYPNASRYVIAEAIFDYPEFIPFRYASCIIVHFADEFSMEPREEHGGIISNYVRFKTVDERSEAERRGIDLERYAKGYVPAWIMENAHVQARPPLPDPEPSQPKPGHGKS